jgi:hypothetical protein
MNEVKGVGQDIPWVAAPHPFGRNSVVLLDESQWEILGKHQRMRITKTAENVQELVFAGIPQVHFVLDAAKESLIAELIGPKIG